MKKCFHLVKKNVAKKLALQEQIGLSFSGMIVFATGKLPVNVTNFVATNVTTNNASLHC